MNLAAIVEEIGFADTILDQGGEISRKLDMLRIEKFPPNALKTLRQFSLSEVADFVGVSQSYLKKLHLEGKGVQPTTSSTGRRSYSAEQMDELRKYLDREPRRRPGDKLQVLAVVNFKGGSGKTTTAAHLAQHLALTGHRVLAIDLDPQASLTALHGIQPELDQNPSLYESLRYDTDRKPIIDVIRPTNFPNLDIVPANLELQEYEYDTPLAMQSKESNAGKTFYTRIGDALAEVDDTLRYCGCRLPSPARLLDSDGIDSGDFSTDHRASTNARHHEYEPVPADARRNSEID